MLRLHHARPLGVLDFGGARDRDDLELAQFAKGLSRASIDAVRESGPRIPPSRWTKECLLAWKGQHAATLESPENYASRDFAPPAATVNETLAIAELPRQARSARSLDGVASPLQPGEIRLRDEDTADLHDGRNSV